MPYNSDLTGKRIKNEDAMITVTVYDEVVKEHVNRHVNDLEELKKWWVAGKPSNGGKVELSSHKHVEISDQTKKIRVNWKNQTFVFANIEEVTDWHNEVTKSKTK